LQIIAWIKVRATAVDVAPQENGVLRVGSARLR